MKKKQILILLFFLPVILITMAAPFAAQKPTAPTAPTAEIRNIHIPGTVIPKLLSLNTETTITVVFADPPVAEIPLKPPEIAPQTVNNAISYSRNVAPLPDGAGSMGVMYITGYCGCVQCCGKWASAQAITASGVPATPNHTVAVYGLPFGTVIYIEGLGEYVVEDRGVGSGVVDVFCATHEECYALTGNYEVWIVE